MLPANPRTLKTPPFLAVGTSLMRRRPLAISALVLLILGGLINVSAQQPGPPTKAKQAADPALNPIEDVAGMPRVLLIGDSISIGYTLTVRRFLEGKANVHRIPANGGPTKSGVGSIEKWFGIGTWDVIRFNWGIHDLKLMPDGKRQVEPADYEANLLKLVIRMKKTGAKLIWATTTPIPDGDLKPFNYGQVKEYNKIAATVMAKNGVAINDLNS